MGEMGARAAFRRLKALLPEEHPPAPVEYTAPLVGFVLLLVLASVVLVVVTFRTVHDPTTLAIGGVVVFAASYCSVRMTGGVDSLWTASVMVQMALTFTFGPIGAIVASTTQAAAYAARMKQGWFRTTFNGANFLVTDLTAWIIFSGLTRIHHGVLWGAISATLAAAAQCLVNNGLLAVVISLASGGKASGWTVFRRSVSALLLYTVGYGWAAYGAVLLYGVAGAVGFTTTLIPIILLQGFLVLLARRIRAQELEREEHAKERESLLQQAIDASDAERKRIASDLHDGVVQTLAGLAFSLAARGAGKTPDPTLLEAADTLRSSVTDRNGRRASQVAGAAPRTRYRGGARGDVRDTPRSRQDVAGVPRCAGGDPQRGQPQSGHEGRDHAALRRRRADTAGGGQRPWLLVSGPLATT
jgi:signal transduction histidine kinase